MPFDITHDPDLDLNQVTVDKSKFGFYFVKTVGDTIRDILLITPKMIEITLGRQLPFLGIAVCNYQPSDIPSQG
jgi:hypothetical protein